jgi:hypothetical protein
MMLSFWSDPIWKGLRIVSFISASVTLIVVVVYLSGVHSWRVPLYAVVATNFGIFTALVIRTLVMRSKSRREHPS